MHNFNFYNPTRIEFGIDKEDTISPKTVFIMC